MSTLKDVRFKLDGTVHAAAKILADSEGVTLERWVSDLVGREVTKRIAVARQIAAVVEERGMLHVAPGPRDRQRHIYFIRRGDDGPIKIGVAQDVQKRLSGLQCASAETLTLLATTSESEGFTERTLHKRFAACRESGEWFTATAELLALVAELQPRAQGGHAK